MFCDSVTRRKFTNISLRIQSRHDKQVSYMISSCMEEKAVLDPKTGVEWSVLGLVQELLKYQNHQLYFDNWFSILQLLLILKEIGIGEVTATFRVS